jgi:hypothetical protein
MNAINSWGIPVGLLTLIIGGLITVNNKLSNRPTYTKVDKTYRKIESCDLIHKNIEDKLGLMHDDITAIKGMLQNKSGG